MKKKIITALGIFVLVGLAAGAYFGYAHWQKAQELGAMRPHIKLATIHLSGVIDADMNPGNITYKDFFKKTEDAIAETEKAEIQLRAVSTDKTAEELKQSLLYTEAVKSFVREVNAFSRYRFSANNSEEMAAQQEDEIASRNEYTSRFARERKVKLLKDAIDNFDKAVVSGKLVPGRAVDVEKHVAFIASNYGADSAPSSQKLQAIAKRYVEITK
jgi:hypothetical protein